MIGKVLTVRGILFILSNHTNLFAKFQFGDSDLLGLGAC